MYMYHKLKILTLNTSHTFDTDPSKLINNKFGDNRHLTQCQQYNVQLFGCLYSKKSNFSQN